MAVQHWRIASLDLSWMIQDNHLVGRGGGWGQKRSAGNCDPGPNLQRPGASAETRTDFLEAVSATTTHQGLWPPGRLTWATKLLVSVGGSFLLSPVTLPQRMSFTDTFSTLKSTVSPGRASQDLVVHLQT